MADSQSSLLTASDKPPNLDNLPELVYTNLFEHLDLDDVWMLKLVSKKLYSIAKEYNLRELCFIPETRYENPACHFDNRWFSTTESIKFIYLIDTSKLDLLVYPSKNVLNLRYLKIEVCPNLFDVEDLNKFSKLQILELLELELNSDHHHHLNLPELKALFISFGSNDSGSLEINAPKVHHLKIDSKFQSKLVNNEIELKNPLSIKYLSAPQFTDNLLAFKRLECLELNGSSPNISMDILKFDHLKKLRINSSLNNGVGALKNLFESKEVGLVIILHGVIIKKVNKIDEYRSSDVLKFQLNNYKALEDDLNCFKSIDYGILLKFVPHYLPSNFVKKFNNIQKIIISSEIKDESRLIHIIKGCKYLYHLDIDVLLSQQFFDKLPEISSLTRLIISTDISLDLGFTIKIPYLVCFVIYFDFLKDQDLNLNSLKHLREIRFLIKNSLGKSQFVEMTKNGCDNYLIDCKRWSHLLPMKKYHTFDGLLKWLDLIRSDATK